MAQIGANVPLDGGWLIAANARKVFPKTQADGSLPAMGGAAARADVRLSPLVVSV